MCGRDGCETDFSFFDAGVDGIQQVSSVLVALGEFSQFFPNQLPLVVAHHLLECWVHILEGKTVHELVKIPHVFQADVPDVFTEPYLNHVVLAGDLHGLLTVIQGSEDRITSPAKEEGRAAVGECVLVFADKGGVCLSWRYLSLNWQRTSPCSICTSSL